VVNNKNHDIEFLRAIAIVYVFLAHIPSLLSPDSFYFKIFNISRFGSGVDLFFCVSGFIVTRSLLVKGIHSMSGIAFIKETKKFYIKRMWRLLPAAFFWIFASLILAVAMEKTHAFLPIEKLLTSALFSVTQTQNFYFLSCRDNGTCGNLGIYWSLSLENQFYLLLPIVLFTFNNKKLCLLMAVVFAVQFFIPRTLNNHTPIGWPLRTDAMALGVIIAVLSLKKRIASVDLRLFSNSIISSSFLIIICFFLAIFTKPEPVIFFQTGLTALASGCLVFIASFNKNYFCKNKHLMMITDYIGSRSYSLYLTHVIALSVTRGLFMNGSVDYTNMGTIIRLSFFFILTFALTEFSFHYIENKYRYYWKRDAKAGRY